MARNECMNAGILAYRPGRHSCLFVYLTVFVLFRHFIFVAVIVDVDVRVVVLVVVALLMNENAFIIYHITRLWKSIISMVTIHLNTYIPIQRLHSLHSSWVYKSSIKNMVFNLLLYRILFKWYLENDVRIVVVFGYITCFFE